MIKYDNSVCVRINDNLKNKITHVCNETNIKEADYIRSRLVNCIDQDVENLHELKQEFIYG